MEAKEDSRESKDDGKHIVRLRGLPWQATNQDIFEFFKGLKILGGEEGIFNVQTSTGRATGEAYVQFETAEDCAEALKKDREKISWRYIEVFQATEEEREKARLRSKPAGQWNGPVSQASSVIRLRGLPFSATDEQIRSFFEPLEIVGVHILMDHLGRPSGEGFVEFPSEELQRRAMSEYNKKYMASRYLEIFRSDVGELSAMMSRGWRPPAPRGRERNERRGPPPRERDYYPPPRRSRYPPSNVESTTCVRMQGIPFEATEPDITKFFQEANVTPLRIHRQEQGGEAYVEFNSPQDVTQAMTRQKANLGRRYIELFRVSYDEMADIVGLPPPGYGPPPPAAAPVGGGYPDGPGGPYGAPPPYPPPPVAGPPPPAAYNPYGIGYERYDYPPPPPDPYYRDRGDFRAERMARARAFR
jgi:RNA recognition motif-containing protein